MNILLVNPWITDFAAYDFWIKPLGLLYAGAFLRKRGHTLRLVDCLDRFQADSGALHARDANYFNTGKFHREIIEKPLPLRHVPRYFCRYGIPDETFYTLVSSGPKPDVVLVTSVMTYWYHGVFEAVRRIKKLLPDVPVVLGGIYATLCRNHAVRCSGADAVLSSPSPAEIVETVESLSGIQGERFAIPGHFNEWPPVPWDLYDTIKTASVLTTRGCPLKCTVCASRILFDGCERQSPESAAAEIIRLAELGAEDIAFCDDALLIDPKRHAVPLFSALADAGSPVRLHTPNGLHVREITPGLARLMKKAGFVTIRLSLETASAGRATDFSGKVTRKQFKQAADALRAAGFVPDTLGAYVLAGLPGQSMEEIRESVAFSISCGIQVYPALFSPVPGTIEFDRALQAGMIRHDDDPILQNNTLRTVDWFPGGDRGYKEFRDMVEKANSSIS